MSTNRMLIFCSFLLLFASSKQVLAGHHGGDDIGPLLGGGLLTLLFAGHHGLSSGGGGHHHGRSAAGGHYSHGSPGGLPQGRTAGILPHAPAMDISYPPQVFHGPAHVHRLGVHGLLPPHGLMGGIPQVHGLGTHGALYGGLNTGSLGYNPGFAAGGIGNDHKILGLQGLGIQGLDNTYFGHNLESHFPTSNLNGHYLSSGADPLTHSGISPGDINTQFGGIPNVPLHNGAFMNHAV